MDNLRGAILMVLAMFGFAIEDMLIKLLAVSMPTWQILVLLGCGGAAIFGVITLAQGQPIVGRTMLSPTMLTRNLGEMIAAVGYVSALALAPLSLVAAVLQATPLAVTMAAALILGETVGWRRWSAISIGFVGVLLVIQPGAETFNAYVLLAVLGVIGLAMRDLATRQAPREVTSMQMSFYGFLMSLPAAFLVSFWGDEWVKIDGTTAWLVMLAVTVGPLAYYAITAAMRVGDVSVVTPFRYSRMVFALIAGVLVFGETPDAMMLAGVVIIVGSGIYTVLRERRLARAR
jgi:drug/metabolite transporter (DMT)-like permease